MMGKKARPSACDGGQGVDLISELGDDLLLRVISLLPDALDLAGLATLSRRWRDLSTRSPTLHLHPVYRTGKDEDDETLKRFNASAHRFNDFIDAVLQRRVCSVDTLHMDVLRWPGGARVNLWLRRAMELVVKSLHLSISLPLWSDQIPKDCKVRLPRCTRAAEMLLDLDYAILRLPAVVEFNALTDLSLRVISLSRGDGRRLGRLLSSTCCPRLQKLELFYVCGLRELQLDARALETLTLYELADLRRLDLDTPRLSSLEVGSSVLRRDPSNFTIRAPALEQLQCSLMPYPREIEI
ncbi:F-box/FBD/LRR-repeat protein At5g56420-like [Aegilops tauschii subsp. strangulata]